MDCYREYCVKIGKKIKKENVGESYREQIVVSLFSWCPWRRIDKW